MAGNRRGTGVGPLVTPPGDVAPSHHNSMAGKRAVDIGAVARASVKGAEVDGVGVGDGVAEDGGGGDKSGGEDAGELHFEDVVVFGWLDKRVVGSLVEGLEWSW